MTLKEKLVNLLRQSEKYTKTDMLYLVKGVFWLNIGKILILIASFSIMVAFANFVSKETYGTYQYIISVVSILAIFSLPGIDTALVKSIVKKKEGTLKLSVKEKIKFSLIGSVILFGVAIWYFIKGNLSLSLPFLIAATFFPFQETFKIFPVFWQAKKDFYKKSKYSFLSSLFVALTIIPVIYYTKNVFYLILAFFLSHTFFDGIFLLKTLRQTKNEEQDKKAISFGKHLTMMSSIASVAYQLDKVILWKFLGPAQVAIYSFAYLPIIKIQELFPVFVLALPKLSEKNIKKIKQGLLEKCFKLILLIVPLVIISILIAPYFYKIVFPQYTESVFYFQILMLLILFVPFQIFGSSLVAKMEKKALYITNTTIPFLRIVLFIILVPFLGIWGIVISILISEFLRCLMYLYSFLKI